MAPKTQYYLERLKLSTDGVCARKAQSWLARAVLEPMCRNIRTLHHFEPPATPEEIEASALQFVCKLSGVQKPSTANAQAFNRAVAQVMKATVRAVRITRSARPALKPRRGKEEGALAGAQERTAIASKAIDSNLAVACNVAKLRKSIFQL